VQAKGFLFFLAIQSPEVSGSFEGTLPCADCPGIVYRVDLFPDGLFYLRLTYLEREGGPYDDIGTYQLDGATLVLKGGREASVYFRWADGGRALVKLDTAGRPIESKHNHTLARIENPSPVEPRLELRGRFTYVADAPVFEECVTRRKFPVAMEKDYLALERAYAEKRGEPGQAILAAVAGRIVHRVNMEGPARPMLVVERFVELRPGETCGGKEPGPLSTAYWKLTQLNGTAVVTVRSEAHLLFHDEGKLAGSDGCNRIFGSYELDGDKIQFGRMGSTLMACPEAVRDRELADALAKASTWRIVDNHLELRSQDDEVLARFEAVHTR
jgi:copper homeostasis protein (lipoprotein)